MHEKIKSILVKSVNLSMNSENIMDDASLSEHVCLSSKQFLTFLMALENEFNLNIGEINHITITNGWQEIEGLYTMMVT